MAAFQDWVDERKLSETLLLFFKSLCRYSYRRKSMLHHERVLLIKALRSVEDILVDFKDSENESKKGSPFSLQLAVDGKANPRDTETRGNNDEGGHALKLLDFGGHNT